MKVPLVLLFAALLAAEAGAGQPAAHVHGVARLDVAVAGENLVILLDSPLDNFLGFEHMPRNAREKAALDQLGGALRRGGEWFQPTPAATCTLVEATLGGPLFGAAKSPAGDDHLDVEAEYRFRCAQPTALRELEVRLFARFPGLKQLTVQVATPTGQRAARLDARQRRLTW